MFTDDDLDGCLPQLRFSEAELDILETAYIVCTVDSSRNSSDIDYSFLQKFRQLIDDIREECEDCCYLDNDDGPLVDLFT